MTSAVFARVSTHYSEARKGRYSDVSTRPFPLGRSLFATIPEVSQRLPESHVFGLMRATPFPECAPVPELVFNEQYQIGIPTHLGMAGIDLDDAEFFAMIWAGSIIPTATTGTIRPTVGGPGSGDKDSDPSDRDRD